MFMKEECDTVDAKQCRFGEGDAVSVCVTVAVSPEGASAHRHEQPTSRVLYRSPYQAVPTGTDSSPTASLTKLTR